jgi:hypothetical protein
MKLCPSIVKVLKEDEFKMLSKVFTSCFGFTYDTIKRDKNLSGMRIECSIIKIKSKERHSST